MKKWIMSLVCCLSLTICLAQEEAEVGLIEKLQSEVTEQSEILKKLQKLKVSGYIQTQYQWGEEYALLKVGSLNNDLDKSFSRFGIRRGRIKFIYEENIASGVFQLDLTEKGIKFKDAYLQVKDPWLKTNSLRAGIFDRPFGFEISYSSSRRESPERSTVFETLFPEERDLGAMLHLQAGKNSPWHFLTLQAGLFAGNGIKEETDSRKDFIGHLFANKDINSNLAIGGGISYYHGSVHQGTENVYKMEGKSFVLNSNPDNIGKFAKRQYFGIDAQLYVNSALGMTQLRGEYLFGQQPGQELGSKSPNTSVLLAIDTYIRQFNGGYVIFIQDLGSMPLSAVLKYDWYDPNTKVKKDEVGLNHTGETDILRHTFGVGMLWRINNSLRLQAYYDFKNNEKTENLPAFTGNLKDDLFTLRLQYKF
ncbi:MAG: OprO/OprP family phosphate-selective porin [Tannerella sp.]|nr:OprO/OprP family phosphate-selective porin [Tannerella sp.]